MIFSCVVHNINIKLMFGWFVFVPLLLFAGAAVMGGKHLASHIDERMIGFAGGTLFILFGLHSLFFSD